MEVPVRRRILIAVVVISAMAFGPLARAQFETRASFNLGPGGATSAVVGDFNGDGVLDLAVVRPLNTTGSVDILLGNGDGTFTQGADYVFGIFPLYAATGSLRNNGVLDLVFNDMLSDDVWVMLGNGDGTFQPAVAYPTTAESYMIALGDFTGNGNVDIIATEGYNIAGTDDCNCVEVLVGNGNGTFGAPITTPLPYGLTGYAIAAGDFNDEGKLDVAAVGESYPNYLATVLLGNGNGTFTADGYYVVGDVPGAVATGYFTESKEKLDLAVINEEGFSVSVLLGNGNGAFQSPVNYYADYPSSLVTQDFSGDGKTDIALAVEPGVALLKGNGNGTFQKGVIYPALVGYIAVGDFNSDGKPDIVGVDEGHGRIIALLNTGVVDFAPTTPLNFERQAVGKTSAPQTVTLTNTGTTELKIQSMKASAEFAVTSTCGARVAPGADCTISATFSPTKQGAAQGTISIIDNASSKPQVIELLGTGT
jgi:hypothetical protein